MNRIWQDNAFWDNDEKTVAKAIYKIEMSDGVTDTQVVTVSQLDSEGNPNPLWDELMAAVGPGVIDRNTEDRIAKKAKEKQERDIKEQQEKQAKLLEKLFNAKLQAFEIDQVRESTNRTLKTKLRRAKSIIEVNVYAMMIVMESIQNESTE